MLYSAVFLILADVSKKISNRDFDRNDKQVQRYNCKGDVLFRVTPCSAFGSIFSH